MLIAGINLGNTRYSKQLKDGGACIIADGEIILAIAEERVTRKKYMGGFCKALEVCLDYCQLSIDDLDLVVVSSCCESPRTLTSINQLAKIEAEKYLYVNHHLSHAISSYALSPFEEALIVVADGGGNTLSGSSPEWWTLPREQLSYYIARRDAITLIGRDFDGPYEAGLGEIYRYFTHHLGWRTSEAGKVMAVAPLGDPDRFSYIKMIDFDSNTGKLSSRIRNIPLSDVTIFDFLQSAGFGEIPPRHATDDLVQVHYDLARYVQDQVTKSLLNKITYLSQMTGIRHLCLAGGVALNCVINDLVLRETPIEDVFIQPAAGDQGQPIGNAIYGAIRSGVWRRPRDFFNVYQGPSYDWDSEITSLELLKLYQPTISYRRVDNIEQILTHAVDKILQGKIVAWVQGRSEIGPRALGNRSILADPRSPSTREKLNLLKQREWFMPIAPSILEEDTVRYFDSKVVSPFMLRAISSNSVAAREIPAVVHFDGTSRIQSVNRDLNPLFYKLIAAFRDQSGVPVLANTSFNRKAEPIVENMTDALTAFFEMQIGTMIVGNWIITRTDENECF